MRIQFRDEIHYIRHRCARRQQTTPALADRPEVGHAIPHARIVRHFLKPLAEKHLMPCVAHLPADKRFRLIHLVHRCLRAVRRNQPLVQHLDAARIAE